VTGRGAGRDVSRPATLYCKEGDVGPTFGYGGPGSLLNSQGHPTERLTPDRDVTNLRPDAA
jgi:hypothetical protein